MNVLIVEDEYAILERITCEVDWKSIGDPNVYTAHNGIDALGQAADNPPDILITDIRMPRMEGTELAEEVLKINAKCKIIFISGYTDKVYLQKAIALQVFDYIEKPINIKLISFVFERAIRETRNDRYILDNSKAYEEKKRMDEMSADCIYLKRADCEDRARVILDKYLDSSKIKESVAIVVKLCSYTDNDAGTANPIVYERMLSNIAVAFSADGTFSICGYNKDCYIIWIFYMKQFETLRKFSEIEKTLIALRHAFYAQGREVNFGVGSFAEGFRSMRESYENAVLAMAQGFFKKPGSINYYSNHASDTFDFEAFNIDDFIKLLQAESSFSAVSLIRSVSEEIKRKDNTSPDMAKRFYYRLVRGAVREAKKEGVVILEDFPSEEDIWMHVKGFNFISEAINFTEACVTEYFKKSREVTDNAIVNKIIRYIMKNYANPQLSVTQISDHLNLTSFYICHIFKDVTDTTIGNFIIDIRLKKAMELLADPDRKIKDIAKMVGYRSGNYFSYQFKKHMGYAPTIK